MTVADSRPHGEDDIVVGAASFADVLAARGHEVALARLSADGVVDVLDGAVHAWPNVDVAPWWRPLENLARLSPLPVAGWDVLLAHVVREPRERLVREPALPVAEGTVLRPGGLLLVVFLRDGFGSAMSSCQRMSSMQCISVSPGCYRALQDRTAPS